MQRWAELSADLMQEADEHSVIFVRHGARRALNYYGDRLEGDVVFIPFEEIPITINQSHQYASKHYRSGFIVFRDSKQIQDAVPHWSQHPNYHMNRKNRVGYIRIF